MIDRLRLVIFDVDGTLVDSQADILASMTQAFEALGRTPPPRQDILQTVGLSLPVGMTRLVPTASAAERDALVDAYKTAFFNRRMDPATKHATPLYPGVAEVLGKLSQIDPLLLGIATGKSRRGLNALLEGHNWTSTFVTTLCADDHPSKPHPSMLISALSETGIDVRDAIIVGDTRYDIEMGQSAGISTLAVSWGYHARDQLAQADRIVDSASELYTALVDWMEQTG